MKKNHIIYHCWLIIFIVLSAFSRPGYAQDADSLKLTLNSAWDRAYKYNKEVGAQRIASRQQQESLSDAKAARLPNVDAGTSYARSTNMTAFEHGLSGAQQIPLTLDYFNLGVSSSLNIYNGGKTNNYINEKQSAASLAGIEETKQFAEIKLKVVSDYLLIQRDEHFKILLQANLKEAEKRLTQMGVLFKNGVVLRSDLLRAKLQISKQQLRLIEVDNMILLARNDLKILIGLPQQTAINLTDSVIVPQLQNAEDLARLTTGAYQDSYDEKIAGKKAEIAKYQFNQSRAAFRPKIDLLANYGYNYPDNIFYPTINRLYGLGQIGVSVSIPLSAFYKNRHQSNVASLEVNRRQLLVDDQKDKVQQATMEAFVNLSESNERVKIEEENITQATENYRIVRNSYFNQLALITDLLDADTQLLQSRFDLENAREIAGINYYQLVKTIGKL